MSSQADADRPSDEAELVEALRRIARSCPRLASACYWAGTSCISIEELHHRRSFDLDFHTSRALQDVRPFATEMSHALGPDFELIAAPDEHGSAFRGLITLPSGVRLTVEVLSNYQDVPASSLAAASSVPGIRRITLRRYVEDKVQCLVERAEARDLVDVAAVLSSRPELSALVQSAMAAQDGILLAERLQSWTDAAIADDLSAYDDVDPQVAVDLRDRLLRWLRSGEKR
jgi:hypothetical protein